MLSTQDVVHTRSLTCYRHRVAHALDRSRELASDAPRLLSLTRSSRSSGRSIDRSISHPRVVSVGLSSFRCGHSQSGRFAVGSAKPEQQQRLARPVTPCAVRLLRGLQSHKCMPTIVQVQLINTSASCSLVRSLLHALTLALATSGTRYVHCSQSGASRVTDETQCSQRTEHVANTNHHHHHCQSSQSLMIRMALLKRTSGGVVDLSHSTTVAGWSAHAGQLRASRLGARRRNAQCMQDRSIACFLATPSVPVCACVDVCTNERTNTADYESLRMRP